MAEMMKKIEELIGQGQMTSYIPKHYTLRLVKVPAPEKYENEYGEGAYSLKAGDPKLEGTREEHWSPSWEKIRKKYIRLDGSTIDPEDLYPGVWYTIQTSPDFSVRRKSAVWAIDAALVSDQPFQVGDLTIDPAVDMLCMGDNGGKPEPEWGAWPVKKDIFVDTYEMF